MLSDVQTPIDLGVINGRVFLTVAATGLDSAVARRVANGGFRIFGHQAYLAVRPLDAADLAGAEAPPAG